MSLTSAWTLWRGRPKMPLVAFVDLSAKLGAAWLHSLDTETEEHQWKTKVLIGSYSEKGYHNKQSGF